MIRRPLPQHYVYAIFGPDARPIYIGAGTGNRWQISMSNSGNKYVRRLRAEFGALPVVKLRERLTQQAAWETEVALIRAIGRADLGAGPLLNLTDGGEHSANLAAESRARMGAAKKGRMFSPETRSKIGAAHRGKTLSPETRAKMRAAQLGKTHSPETHSPETRAKISAGNLGKTRSPETRAKIGAAHKGKPLSAAHRAAVSAGVKGIAARKLTRILARCSWNRT